MPAGRPIGTGKYRDGEVIELQYETSHPEKLLQLMKEGKLDCQIFAEFGICKDTYYRWLNEYPKFQHAHEVGLPICEAWWIEWGKKGMQGELKGFNFNSWISFMNNKFKWSKGTYGDTGNNTITNVTVQNMNILQQKGKDDLIEYIKRIGDKNQDILDVKFVESDQPPESNKE